MTTIITDTECHLTGNTDTLEATNLYGDWKVEDADGGIWTPNEEVATAAEALDLCRANPMAGTWAN